MEHSALLDLSVDLGCGLLESGAEIYRAEDSVRRLLAAYELEGAEVFAIPNCLIASVTTPAGEPLTRVRRVPEHGTDIWRLERYNALCRALCRDTPPPGTGRAMLARVEGERREYPLPVRLLGYVLGAAAFCLFFGGTGRDALCSGACGLAIALTLFALARVEAGGFFRTLTAAAVSALLALTFVRLGTGENLDAITIGAFMALTPGVALTNSMREFMAGDMVSGVSRLTDALLTATAIALSTGVVLALGGVSLDLTAAGGGVALPCVYAFFACLGFCFLFNNRGVGMLICCVGGALGWLVYLVSAPLVGSDLIQAFLAAVVIAVFSELMARVRRCPVTAYLLIALFPLVPGRGIYLTMLYCIQGETLLFLSTLVHTIGFAGCLAVGAMLVSAVVRMYRSLAARRSR